MKVVILAGGLGSRLSEETHSKPKPMIEIGNKPIIWHIMKLYSFYGYNDFIICCGYMGYVIKEYFFNYSLHNSDVEINLKSNKLKVIKNVSEPWNITLVDTGLSSNTGERIKRIKEFIKKKENFFMTYGDGLGNINIGKLLIQHKKSKKLATVTSVKPVGRFGSIVLNADNSVKSFQEKTVGNDSWINGGFFVLNYKIFDYIKDDNSIFERTPLEKLAKEKQLQTFIHRGFWHPMDTLRDKIYLNNLYKTDSAKWKIWKD